jgi:hypothetical protein
VPQSAGYEREYILFNRYGLYDMTVQAYSLRT